VNVNVSPESVPEPVAVSVGHGLPGGGGTPGTSASKTKKLFFTKNPVRLNVGVLGGTHDGVSQDEPVAVKFAPCCTKVMVTFSSFPVTEVIPVTAPTDFA
jgi:hypothetical protein